MVKRLSKGQKKRMLKALEEGIWEYRQTWDKVGYNLLKNTIKRGELINPKDIMRLGTPMTEGRIGEEHFFFLKGKDGKVNLVVQIPKHTAFTPKIGYSAFKIVKEGKKWRVIEGRR